MERWTASCCALNRRVGRSFTTDLLRQAEPKNSASEDHVTLLEVLDRAADEVGVRFKSQPEVEGALRASIAGTYHGLASWDKAERQYRALMGLARRPGAKPGEYFAVEAELAHILRHRGRLDDEVLAMARSANEGLKRTLGPDHPDTLKSMTNLASSYDDLGRHAEALELNEETLALTKARLGPDHPHTLTSMHNLASSYDALGRNAEALKLREETLALRKARLGPNHPDSLRSMHSLALSYYALAKHAEALKLCEETLALMKVRLGSNHPDTLASMNNLALSYYALGRHAEALKLHEETLAVRKARLGPNHPDTLTSMTNLANSYAALGRHAEALKLCEKTLALTKARLGPDHPDTLMSMHNLASCYDALGRHAEALELREETLALMKARLGPDHPDTLMSMTNLALSYYDLGRHAEALKLHEETLAIQRKPAPDHPGSPDFASALGATLNNMAKIDLDAKRFEEARVRLREAVEWQRKALASNPANPTYRQFLANHLTNLITASRGLGDPEGVAEAERELARLRDLDPAMAALDARLSSIIRGDQQPRDTAERLQLAQRAYDKALLATAARLWGEALEAHPKLGDDRRAQHRYNAACIAALAGSGQGKDDPPPDEAGRVRLRRQALVWLRAEMAAWSRRLDDDPKTAAAIQQTMKHWRTDPDLAGLRDEAEIARLPEAERESCRSLWAEVDRLLAKAGERMPY